MLQLEKLTIYNAINISHFRGLTAKAFEEDKSSECNRFFVTYIHEEGYYEVRDYNI